MGLSTGQKPKQEILNKEFLEKEFGAEHQEAFPGTELYAGGWPDMGNGRYSMKAGYKAWYDIVKSQRIHQNFAESINQLIVC